MDFAFLNRTLRKLIALGGIFFIACSLGVPANHRATTPACNAPRPASITSALDGGSLESDGGTNGQPCRSDADCTSGLNGRCVFVLGAPTCSYDECAKSSDCQAGNVCDCRDPDFASLDDSANSCLPGNCVKDSDCGPGGYCSPARSGCIPLRTAGFFCHTLHDECANDSDCSKDGRVGFPICNFDSAVGHWRCMSVTCAG